YSVQTGNNVLLYFTVSECALQLRRIGDKWNLQQRILNLISKLFCPGT
ncbi:phorbol-12-myristate-13-acetate-induced protein 1, partial [Python bivittatus]|uniref:Phorbol-12-myristate-13-acetate-induced protein 1 n=1 Tax=Python bivittatus TaxID=176946 RepID=A0A9F2QZH0_PYTBI